MDTRELLKKVRRIEIKTRGLTNQIFSGEYHSAFKGRGMAFSEVREYMPGDEIRTIDWNVTARLSHPYVKVFEEERELTLMLLADMSASESFGTRNQLKREMLAEICAVLAFSAVQNNDKVGISLFTDEVELFIPPKKGRSHALRIIREILDFDPKSKGTDVNTALQHFTRSIKRKSIGFVISDFLDHNFERSLKIAAQKHDMVAIRLADHSEEELPNVGIAQFRDPETGEMLWINTSSKKARTAYKAAALQRAALTRTMFKRSGVDFAEILTHEDYVRKLMGLFQRRIAAA